MSSHSNSDHQSLVQRIEQTTEIPMLLLAIAYIPLFMMDYLPNVSSEMRTNAEHAENAIIAIFAIELIVRVAAADRRLAYLRTHWLDAVVVLIPFLRPIRFLRVLRLLPVLVRGTRGLRRFMGPYRGAYIVIVGLASVLMSAILMTVMESGQEGSIQDFGDALWWAVATITTVGYGDMTPVTPEGRAIAAFLMVVGIALFGMLTAGLAAYFVGGESDTVAGTKGGEQADAAQRELVEQLRNEVAFLRQELERKDMMLMHLTQRLAELPPLSPSQHAPDSDQ